RGKSTCGEPSRSVGTEREFWGQRDWGNSPFESIQITTILNHNDSKSQFEMILVCKRSKQDAGNAVNSGIICVIAFTTINPCSAASSAKTIHRRSIARPGGLDRCCPCLICWIRPPP